MRCRSSRSTRRPGTAATGHGLRADGFRTARWWVATLDDPLRHLLTDAGWAPDGSTREIGSEDEAVRLKQVRLHTDLS